MQRGKDEPLQLPVFGAAERAEAPMLKRGVYTMGALGKGGEQILWAVASTGRRVREVLVESEQALPDEIEHLWGVLERVDPIGVPLRARLRVV